LTCASCGAGNREGRKFCSECGTALAVPCPSCGAANEPGEVREIFERLGAAPWLRRLDALVQPAEVLA